MQNSSGAVKAIISILAVVCIILAVVFTVKNKPECADNHTEPEPESYNSYQEDYSVSGGDITIEDNSTEEMDTIPNEEAAPAVSQSDNA